MTLRVRASALLVACACVAAVGFEAPAADAFELKHTSSGEPVKWTRAQSSFVIDPSVTKAIPEGDAAVQAAAAAWSGQQGAPVLTTTAGGGGATVAVDGQNSVVYAPHGFAPAGNALAITVLSYDDTTGAIVDADIVINGRHHFALLDEGARAAAGSASVSNEGAADDGATDRSSAAFDLQHVVTHEVGHALGLGDVSDESSAVMYGVSFPGDASKRALSADDQDGLGALYGASPAPRAGCGQASVAGGPVRSSDAWLASWLVAGAVVWATGRRRARVVVTAGALAFAWIANPAPAFSRPVSTGVSADARAVVVAASTHEVDGVAQTTLDLVPVDCRTAPCPARARAVVWGGTVNGITQVVGESRAPDVGDAVDVGFSTEDRAAEVRQAFVVGRTTSW